MALASITLLQCHHDSLGPGHHLHLSPASESIAETPLSFSFAVHFPPCSHQSPNTTKVMPHTVHAFSWVPWVPNALTSLGWWGSPNHSFPSTTVFTRLPITSPQHSVMYVLSSSETPCSFHTPLFFTILYVCLERPVFHRTSRFVPTLQVSSALLPLDSECPIICFWTYQYGHPTAL